jgi:hypothetical protein
MSILSGAHPQQPLHANFGYPTSKMWVLVCRIEKKTVIRSIEEICMLYEIHNYRESKVDIRLL